MTLRELQTRIRAVLETSCASLGCLGGPETHCDCQGFREEES